MPVSPERIVEHLRNVAGRPLKAKELAQALDVATADYHAFRDLLQHLEDEGVLYRVKGQRFAAPEKINLIVGRLQTIRSGAGFVIPEDGAGDLYVSATELGSALDGDRVVARVERRRRGQRQEGRIIKVLERARETIVGTYHPARNFGFVVPEDPKLVRDVFVPPGQEGGAQDGDMVVVRVSSWGDEHLGPAGEIERVLGRLGMPGVDVLAVIYGHELPVEFPGEVEGEAERIRKRGILRQDLRGRTDLRDRLIFTIDPADAKDHDDALSIERATGGLWQVGVHIADVACYVQEGSALDAEALRRGTSVYLVDRVVPMLPEALSSDLCSLRPDQDRLALSLLLTVAEDGKLHGHELVRSVIRSRHRLSYDDAQAVLDGTRSIEAETDRALRQLLSISRALRASREARGSLDFDLPEARVVLNTQGEPTDIQRVLRLESHRLIEDFMLLANETIARQAARRRVPLLYRIHEPPDDTRIEQLREFVGPFGLRLGTRGQATPKDLQRLLERVRGRPEENLVSTIVLRSMKQARYSPENLGHFGLAAHHYTHFTSPIRRYPDLIVHRLCARAFLEEEAVPAEWAEHVLPTIARIASERERVAVEAERDSIDLKKVEFMQRHLGEEFAGTISGVTSFGCFVLLDTFFVEGLVHVSSLDDDYYAHLEEQYALVGEHTRRRLQLGQRVRVRVAGVNLEERKIDFQLAGEV
ncbi:MAG: ribonuclease R [Gemmatimonadetes bacterium]|nr:ribonuclease R [Gemmatimonadota bacterium]